MAGRVKQGKGAPKMAELSQHPKKWRVLHKISLAMNSCLSSRELLQLLVREAVNLLKADSSVIFLLGEDGKTLEANVVAGRDKKAMKRVSVQVGDGIIGWVAKTGRPQFIPDVTKDNRYLLVVEGIRSEATVPLIAGDRVIGVLNVESRKTKAFDKIDLELLTMFASQAARVLENARVYEDTNRRYRQIQALYEVQQTMVETLDFERVLSLIAEKVVEVMEVKASSIRLLDPDGEELVIAASHNLSRRYLHKGRVKLKESFIDQEALKGNLVSIIEVADDERFVFREEARAEGVHSLLCAPLRVENEAMGVIRVYTDMRRSFSDDEQKLLSTFAGQAALIIKNAKLYKEWGERGFQLTRSQSKLKEVREALIKKEKLAALGQMAARVAHEIRNPLTSIRGFSQRLFRKMEGREGQRYAEIIIGEVDRLNRVISDILDFARPLQPELKMTDMNELMREVLDLVEIEGSHITLKKKFSTNLPMAMVDRQHIKQALLNLIHNGIEAMAEGGNLLIGTESANGAVLVRITDSGPGIAKEVRGRIFEPFFTTKARGTGLGLALANKIIESHNGKIEVESKQGRGATFTILLPEGRE
ncbi:GAF domain-containing protein [bacterium]|nr:GAF domain-containing protein [bacterium]MCK4325664.1 GAF domain-containing protein [bacterium]